MSVASALFPSLGHRWLQLPTFGAIQIQFQISMSYTKGAHSITHLRGQLLTFWGILDSVSNFTYPLLISNLLHTPSLLNARQTSNFLTRLYLIVCTCSFCMTAQSFSYGNTEQDCINSKLIFMVTLQMS